ncbi:hypothetical protein [Actinomadura sp. WMMB 499]|uniref:hypothetical protein n=1 Tax=Actinomadura sp. WMMB 499 TaxID=1219491 RepID=UPI00124860A7|nr:hypothetical protein [Actinomadura sp. WMMB 499]QFG20411.1 hypothetical protein F7P10_03775 [Actinomadura sp. WMMB 499]
MPSKKIATLALAGTVTVTCLATIGAAHAQSSGAAQPSQARQAPAGYQIVKLPNANVPNFQRRTVYCPSGKQVIGGGAEAQGNDAILVGSFPTDDGRGWIGLGRQKAYSSVGISVYAICAS